MEPRETLVITKEPRIGRASRKPNVSPQIPQTVEKIKVEGTVKEARGFIAWSIPAAVFLALGIVMAAQNLPWFIALLASLLCIPIFLRKMLRWVLPFVLCLPIGYFRFDSWSQQSSPLAALLNQTVTVSGVSDGQYLKLDEPKGVRVVLAPKGKVEAGRVTLTGTIVQATGKRNPGGFDYQAYLRRQGVWAQLFVNEIMSLTPAKMNFKDRLQQGVIAGLSETQAGLMQAMTLGIRDDLGELRELFSASGLAHILALSGLHVGILVLALNFVLKALGLGRLRFPLMILLIAGFVMMVGATPSVVRAGVMSCAVLISLWLGSGRIEAWPALTLSAVLALLWNPSWLFDLSFQLSYLAVAGLLLFTEPMMKIALGQNHQHLAWWHWKKLLLASMIVSLAAQLLTLPLVASSFGSLPLLSPLVNVVAIPLATMMVPLGFTAGLLSVVALPLASLLNDLTGLLANALIALADFGSSLPHLIWGEVSGLGYTLFYLAVLALALVAQGKLKLWQGLLVVTAAISASMLTMPRQQAEVIFLDVGQGDSALIRLPGRQEILMDGGGSPFGSFDVGKRIVVPALKALGIDELELVIASHNDTDHVEGLISVLEEMKVNQLVIGARKDGDALFDKLMAAATRNNVPVMQVTRTQTLSLVEARLNILNPPHKLFEKDNDNSVAFALYYKDEAKALFLGDLSVDVEAGIAFPKVDILMAGHHGSPSSTSEKLLRAAQPEHVVFSYGRNNYGHPHGEVMQRVLAIGATVHETFHSGAVRLRLD